WRGRRPHHESQRRAGRCAVDVDVALRLSRGPHADARLRADARGCDGGFREELAAEVTNISYGLSKRRLTAFERPPRAGPISYATSGPATNVFMPAASTSWIWTKTSGPPSSGRMEPNPRSGLKDLTRPVRHGPSLNVPPGAQHSA